MNSASVLHWVVVLGIFAGIVFFARYLFSPSKNNKSVNTVTNPEVLKKPMQWLTRFFSIWILSTVLLIAFVGENSSRSFKIPLSISLLAMLVGGFGFYICLGILAKRLGKSWIIWVGLTVLTNPIGAFVAYFRMRSLVIEGKQEVNDETAP